MAFSKKDYVKFAEVVQLCDSQEQGEEFHRAIINIAFNLCESFHDAQPNITKNSPGLRFDPKRFLLACGLSDEDVARYYMLRGTHDGSSVS